MKKRHEDLNNHGTKYRWNITTLQKQKKTQFQENHNTPAKHTPDTPGNPLANYERNPFIACW